MTIKYSGLLLGLLLPQCPVWNDHRCAPPHIGRLQVRRLPPLLNFDISSAVSPYDLQYCSAARNHQLPFFHDLKRYFIFQLPLFAFFHDTITNSDGRALYPSDMLWPHSARCATQLLSAAGGRQHVSPRVKLQRWQSYAKGLDWGLDRNFHWWVNVVQGTRCGRSPPDAGGKAIDAVTCRPQGCSLEHEALR